MVKAGDHQNQQIIEEPYVNMKILCLNNIMKILCLNNIMKILCLNNIIQVRRTLTDGHWLTLQIHSSFEEFYQKSLYLQAENQINAFTELKAELKW